jgi:RND family efflux transporter MFP subunit
MESQTAGHISMQGTQSPASGGARGRRSRRGWIIAAVVFLIFAGVLIFGIFERVHTSAALRGETADLAVPTVTVVAPKQAAQSQEIVLPGNVQPYIQSPVFARTNGYLEHWYFDIGAHVKKGQLLAVIASPEIDQQLQQAQKTLLTAEANLELASITKDRYQGLKKTNAVSQQDVDNAVGTYNANKAIVEADQATVQQYSALVSFEKVYAPFDGVITARNTDIGDLINSGSNANVKTDLFHIAQPGVLRVYVNVPEEYSQQTAPGLTADLTLAEFPGKSFTGKLVRTAESINYTTRTLLVEVDVKNPSNQLLSGAYAEVHFKVPGHVTTYILPVEALLFRKEGLRIAIVNNGKAELIPVTPGRDFGNSIEIISGLKGNEAVITSPPDSIVTGEQVQVSQPSAAPASAPSGAKQ